jgi:hypothetical protein
MPIPRKIIQGWIGPNPIPARERKWCDEMRRMNAGWDYVCFGNEALEKYGQDPYVKALVNRNRPWAFVADRIRVLMLMETGGVWLDCDCQPIRPLDTLAKIWDAPEVEFVMGFRNPYRPMIALHRGVTLCDNTMVGSSPNSRLIRRVLNLWRPDHVQVNGHDVGVEVMANLDGATDRMLGYRYFYDLEQGPQTLVLHDSHNLGSWTAQMKAERMATTS